MDKCACLFLSRGGFTLQRVRAFGTADQRRIKRAQELPPFIKTKILQAFYIKSFSKLRFI